MRPMDAAESNMNLFSRRLKKMGYSWSLEGLEGMVSAMIHNGLEGTLFEAIQRASCNDTVKSKLIKYPSFASLLTEKASQEIGAIKGHMPALIRDDQGKPYTKALRGLAGL